MREVQTGPLGRAFLGRVLRGRALLSESHPAGLFAHGASDVCRENRRLYARNKCPAVMTAQCYSPESDESDASADAGGRRTRSYIYRKHRIYARKHMGEAMSRSVSRKIVDIVGERIYTLYILYTYIVYYKYI